MSPLLTTSALQQNNKEKSVDGVETVLKKVARDIPRSPTIKLTVHIILFTCTSESKFINNVGEAAKPT